MESRAGQTTRSTRTRGVGTCTGTHTREVWYSYTYSSINYSKGSDRIRPFFWSQNILAFCFKINSVATLNNISKVYFAKSLYQFLESHRCPSAEMDKFSLVPQVEIGKITFFPVPVFFRCLLKLMWLRKCSQSSWFLNAYKIYINDLESMLLRQPIRMYQNSESVRVEQLFLEIMSAYFSATLDLHLYIYFLTKGGRGYA
jgi:hypothetical protein